MQLQVPDYKYRFIFAALIFLALGLMTSPTIVAGYQILIIIPAFLTLYKAKNKKLSKSSLMLLALGLWGLLSALYNLNTLQGAGKSFREVTSYFYGVLFIFPLTYFFRQGIQRHWKIILNMLITTIILAFFVGISKAWFHFDPVKFKFIEHHGRSGGFFNYMRYGYSSGLMFVLGLGMLLNREKIKDFLNIKYLMVGVCFCLAAIGSSQTRGALLGIITATPFLLYRYQRRVFKWVVVAGGIFIAIVVYFSFISNVTKLRFLNINDGSNNVRVSQWYTALKVAQDNPVFGVGPDQFSYNVTTYKKKYDIWGQHYSAHAHNIVLEHLANYGFVGLLFFLLFFAFWLSEMLSLKTDFGWIVGCYILGFFVSGQVEMLFDVVNSNLLFFIYSYSQYIYSKDKFIHLET